MDKDDVFPGSIDRIVIPMYRVDEYGATLCSESTSHWWYGEPVTEEEYNKLVREWKLRKTIEELLK